MGTHFDIDKLLPTGLRDVHARIESAPDIYPSREPRRGALMVAVVVLCDRKSARACYIRRARMMW